MSEPYSGSEPIDDLYGDRFGDGDLDRDRLILLNQKSIWVHMQTTLMRSSNVDGRVISNHELSYCGEMSTFWNEVPNGISFSRTYYNIMQLRILISPPRYI